MKKIIILLSLIMAANLIGTVIVDHPIIAQGPVEIISARDQHSKTFDLGGGKYSLDVSIGSIHYKDDPDDPGEQWKDIDTKIVESPKPQWDWEVVKGNWHLLIREDTAVAIGKNGNWLGFRYSGFGYLDWASKDYVILQDRLAVAPVLDGNRITWPGIFMGTDLEYVYSPDGFKENLYVSQATRDWLQDNPPSSFGLDNATSYLVGIIECDWQQSFPAEAEDGTAIKWDNAHEFISSGVFWRDPVKDKIVTALPLGETWQIDDPTNSVNLHYRFYKHTDGTHYLLFGAKVTDLNGLPPGTIIIDPTVNEQVGAGDDDADERGNGVLTIDGDTVSCNSRTDPDSQYYIAAGWRFQTVAIPQGATIDSAYMEVYCVATSDPGLYLYGNDVDDADNFDTTPYILSETERPRTTASTYWYESGTITLWQDTPDIGGVIEEIIDRPGWSSDNDLAILAIGITTENFKILTTTSYEDNSILAAKLHVEYTVGGCSPSIEIDQSAWNINSSSPVSEDSTYNTGLDFCTITNNSGGAVDIYIQGTDMTGGGYTWDLSDDASNGDMVYGMHSGLYGGSYNIVVKESTTNLLKDSLADSGTQDFGLQIYTPTNFDDGNAKSGTITITAVCE